MLFQYLTICTVFKFSLIERKSLHDKLNQTETQVDWSLNLRQLMIALKVNCAYESGDRPWPIGPELIPVSAV